MTDRPDPYATGHTREGDATASEFARLADRSGATECAREVIGWTSSTAGTAGNTITPPDVLPVADHLSPYTRHRLEKLLEGLEQAAELVREQLRAP